MLLDLVRGVSTVLAAAAISAACGGSSNPTTPSTDLSVGGTYDTAVTLTQNSCGSITVQRNATTVTHTPGAATLTVTHVGNAYSGTVQRNGAFSTTAKAVTAGSETHTLTITGTFTTTAIDATVAAVVQRAGAANCEYTVKWAGPKQGAPNVIPGN
jgi:hypothetical protein